MEATYEAGCLVAGAWLTDGPRAERVGPYLRRRVSTARTAESSDITAAAAYVREAQRVVARLAPATRAEILDRAAGLVTERGAELARLLALELGKPLKDGRGEVARAVDTLSVAAAEARAIGGETLPVAGWARGVGHTALTHRAPAGPVLAITPFNAPVNLLAHKLAAAFAAGNTTIVKPPPQAPAASTELVRILLEAGLPVEAVQVLHGGGDVGAALCAVPEIAVVSFTGSAAAGAAVAHAAGPKRVMLELGGNAATIVCEDADLDQAAAVCARTGFSNSGQSCISVQRVYVQSKRFDEFVEALTSQVKSLVVGDPLDEGTDVGSMVDDEAAERVVRWSAESGGTVTAGGGRTGGVCAPTVVAAPSPDSTLVTEEVFGACVAVLPYEDFGAVIETCNRSRYGLQAGLFTHDVRRIVQAWRDLEVGGLVVNGSSNFRLDHVPFGGVKDSGIGRESPRWMIEDFTVTKTLLLRGMSIWGER